MSIGEAREVEEGGGRGGGEAEEVIRPTCGQCMVKAKGIANSQHLLPNAHLTRLPKLHGLQCFLHHPLNFPNTVTQSCR